MLRQRIHRVVDRDVIGVGPDDLMSTALGLMREHSISCVPVLEGSKPVGMITERGLVRHMAGNGATLEERPVRGVMNAPVVTINQDMYVYEALQTFLNKGIRHLVVVDETNRATGVLTLSDLIEDVGSDLMVEFQPVDMHMSRAVYALEEDHNLLRVLHDLADKNISCVLYLKDGKPVGLMTERDLVRLATNKASLKDIRFTEAMSSPVVTVKRETAVHEAVRLMRTKKIRRVVVVDDQGRVAGLATQTNIIRSLETNYIRILKEVINEKESDLQDTSSRLDRISLYLDSILNTSIDMAIVATDMDFRVIFYNHCSEAILGLKPEEVMGRHVLELHQLVEVEVEHFEALMKKIRDEGRHSFQYQRMVEGEERCFQARVAAILDKESEIEGYVFMVRDITERKRAEENIRFMAYHDILTGLPNRVSFDERLKLELAHAERNDTRLAVLAMDLDHFKEVNDTMGHFAGDLLLGEVAGRLVKALRKSDTVARVGGDEFMMILPSITSDENVLQAAAKMAEVLRKPVEIKGRPWQVFLSMGVSFYPDQGKLPRLLVDLADQAMYEAKKQGHGNAGSNICLYDEKGVACRKIGA